MSLTNNHHTDSAIYQPILDVPVTPFVGHKELNEISRQYGYFSLPESVDRVCKYDYRLEEAVIKAADEAKQAAQVQAVATAERRKRFEANRAEAAAARREAEAKKVKSMAPGFSADAVLQPTTAQSPILTGIDPDNKEAGNIGGDQRTHKLHNYLEFEQGLPPPNPWDTPQSLDDDLKTLGGVMPKQEDGKRPSKPTSPVKPDNSVMGFHIGPSPLNPPLTYAQQPPDYFSQGPYHSAPIEYVPARVSNMNIRNGVQPGPDGSAENNVQVPTMMYPLPAPSQQYASQPGPPRPPKNFDTYEPRLPTFHIPQPHLMSNPLNSPSSMPQGPPLEGNPVNKLMNMGFSQQQATDALQRNNYNMEGALNFLLDHSGAL